MREGFSGQEELRLSPEKVVVRGSRDQVGVATPRPVQNSALLEVEAPVTPVAACPRHCSSSPMRIVRPSGRPSLLGVVGEDWFEAVATTDGEQDGDEAPEVVNVSGIEGDTSLRAEACCPGGHRLLAEKAVDDLFACHDCKDDVFKEGQFLYFEACDYMNCGTCVICLLWPDAFPWHLGKNNLQIQDVG